MNELIEVLNILENNILEHIERFFHQQLLFANFNNPEFLQSKSPLDNNTPDPLQDEQHLASVMKRDMLLEQNQQEEDGRVSHHNATANSPVDYVLGNRRPR